jgi:hypothetical protein
MILSGAGESAGRFGQRLQRLAVAAWPRVCLSARLVYERRLLSYGAAWIVRRTFSAVRRDRTATRVHLVHAPTTWSAPVTVSCLGDWRG